MFILTDIYGDMPSKLSSCRTGLWAATKSNRPRRFAAPNRQRLSNAPAVRQDPSGVAVGLFVCVNKGGDGHWL